MHSDRRWNNQSVGNFRTIPQYNIKEKTVDKAGDTDRIAKRQKFHAKK